MPNKKENMLKVYDGDKWIYKNKDELVEVYFPEEWKDYLNMDLKRSILI